MIKCALLFFLAFSTKQLDEANQYYKAAEIAKTPQEKELAFNQALTLYLELEQKAHRRAQNSIGISETPIIS